jgi:hypothetical protein
MELEASLIATSYTYLPAAMLAVVVAGRFKIIPPSSGVGIVTTKVAVALDE